MPTLSGKSTLADALAENRGHGFDVFCREVVGACYSDIMQATPEFFEANRHVVTLVPHDGLNKLLRDSDGPVDFDGQFLKLSHARLDTEPYEGRFLA